MQNTMSSKENHRSIVCKKGRLSGPTAARRVRVATEMLQKYPNKEDWHRVRFSDEVHFGWGIRVKIRIIVRVGERYCPDCLQKHAGPAEKDKKNSTAGLRLGITSSQAWCFMTFLATQMAR
jgi:hypothetical protein